MSFKSWLQDVLRPDVSISVHPVFEQHVAPANVLVENRTDVVVDTKVSPTPVKVQTLSFEDQLVLAVLPVLFEKSKNIAYSDVTYDKFGDAAYQIAAGAIRAKTRNARLIDEAYWYSPEDSLVAAK